MELTGSTAGQSIIGCCVAQGGSASVRRALPTFQHRSHSSRGLGACSLLVSGAHMFCLYVPSQTDEGYFTIGQAFRQDQPFQLWNEREKLGDK